MSLIVRGCLTLAIMLGLAVGSAQADVKGLDFAHNSVKGIGCNNCHYYTTDTPPSWATQIPENVDDTAYNNLCWGCHNNAIAAYVKTHSSLTSNKYGSWTVECHTCHTPKHQTQARTWKPASYLATGASTGLTLRTLTKAGAGWTVNAFSGSILIPNTAKISYQYPIVSNTSDTITLSADIDVGIATVGNPFAVIYGQLIRTPIVTPNSGSKTVKFFQPTGANSFADGNATYDGICEICHTQTTHFRNNGTGADPNHSNLAVAGKAGTNCIPCHKHGNGFSHTKGQAGCGTVDTCHGTLKSHPTHLQDSDMVTAVCEDCHDINNFPKFKDGEFLATTTACNACHGSGVAMAKQYFAHPGSETLTAGSWIKVEGDASYCGSCHGATIESAHNNFGLASSCSDCHKPLTTKTHIVNLHFNGACSTCHISSSEVVQNTILNGKSHGGNMQVECVDCHTGPGVNTMHAMAIVVAELQTRHDKLGASANSGNDPNDCAMCHIADTTLARLALHPSCLRCHDNVDTDVNTAVTNGIAGNNVNCESCHDAKGQNLLHGLTSATVSDVHDQFSTSTQTGEANCANCHVLTTVANRLDLHIKVSPATSACKRCHTSADSNVVSYITSGILGNAVNCESCHDAKGRNLLHGLSAATVGDVHNNIAVSSGCTDCHGALATKADIISLHHNGACSNCHGSADAAVQNAITTGNSRGGNTQVECITCHTGPGVNSMHGLTSSNAELQTRHNMFGVSISVGIDPSDCALCHTMSTLQQRLDLHSSCLSCHASADPDVVGAISRGVAGATANCENCHDAKGENRMHGLTEDTVYDLHNMLAASNQGGQQNCANCHLLDTTSHKLNMHANLNIGISGCKRCHGSADVDVQNAINNGREPGHQVGGGNGLSQYCETCHSVKGKNLLHGLTTATVVDVHDKFSASSAGVSESNCGNCHVTDTADNRLDLHVACTTCHTTHATDTSIRSTVINDGREPNHEAEGGNGNTKYCESCHTAKNQYSMHGLTINDASDVHNNFTSSHTGEKACQSCHGMATAANSLDLHPQCSSCHTRHATDGSAKTLVINDGRESGHKVGGGNNKAKNCESCHTAKGIYKLHGLTDDNGADGVADVHDKLTGSTGVAITFTNAKIILKDTNYNCANCHTINQGTENAAAWASRIQQHTSAHGTGRGSCLTCHSHAGSADEVTLGRKAGTHLGGGGNTAIDCENCHDSGNGPSGKAMYQYDGARHHQTGHAQKGDCTYCHADPRPATVSLTHAWAETADIDGAGADTHADGWATDIGAVTVRKQLVCRECHTNRANQYQNPGYASPPTVNTGGNDLIVYKNTYTPANLTSAPGTTELDVTDNGVPKTVQVEKHRIVSSGGTITPYNFGSCFSCHTIQAFHARPAWSHGETNPVEDEPYDVLRFAPGRGKFNLFERCTTSNYPGTNLPGWQHGVKCAAGQPHDNSDPTKTRAKTIYKNVEGADGSGAYETVAPGLNSTSNIFQQLNTGGTGWTNTGTAPYIFGQMQSIPRSSLVNNLENSLTANTNIPYFTDITAPVLDDITITKAEWSGSVVTVWATNSLGSGQTIKFSYSDSVSCNNTTMNWDGAKFSGTCNTSTYSSQVATVTVTNTGSGGSRTASVVNNGLPPTAPILSINQPDGTADGVISGAAYNITYSLADYNDTVTAAFYYDTNNSGLDGVAITGACATAAEGSGATCSWNTTGMTPGVYYVYGIANDGTNPAVSTYSSGPVTVYSATDVPPTLSVAQPDGVSDSYYVGDSYNITYSLSDADEVVTAAFYYDTDNVGVNGTAIAGACASAAEGTNVTCSWNTTGMAAGSYYVYGVANDGANPDVTAYSPGAINLTAPVSLVSPATRLTASSNTNAISATYTAGAGQDRIVLITVAWDDASGDTNETLTGTYGGQTVTQVSVSRSSDGRQAVWVGYVNEAKLIAKSGDTISLSFDGDGTIPDYASIAAMTFTGAEQTAAPVAVIANGTTGTAYAWSGLAVLNKGYVVYVANGDSTTSQTFDPPPPGGTNDYTERFDNWLNSAYVYTIGDKAITATGTSAETLTFSTSARWALIAVSISPNVDQPPAITISQPDGVSDAVTVGASYNITYTLSDADEVVTATFYYDSDNTGLNGTAITGSCATAPEGTNVTCAWNTTGVTPGQYYVYATSSDAVNPTVSAYSAGRLTINPNSAPTVTISQPDGTGDTVIRGATYNITYTLADSDNVVTAAFYYDTNNTGLDGTAITGACATAGEGTLATCAWNTATVPAGSYYVYALVNDGINPAVSRYSNGRITINANSAPTLSISQPDGVSDAVTVGSSYNLTYTLADSDNTVTAAFYYDTNNTGLDGTAIAGACATATEGTGITCAWNTTGMTPGQYYVYGVVSDGVNSTVSAYSAGKLTINANIAPTISISQPDGVGDTDAIGVTYNLTYTLADPDNTVTAAFYYDTDNSGLNGTAITGVCATAAEGTNVTCAWNTTGMAVGTYYIYAIVNDGANPAVSAYSSGQITLIAPATVASAAAILTTSGGGTNQISASYAAGAGANRLVLITVAWETSSTEADTNETLTGTYGGQVITQVALSRTSDGRQGVWVGYVTEAKLAAKSGNTIILNFDGDTLIPDRSPTIAAMTYANASQALPTAVTAIGTAGTAFNWSGLAVANGGYAMYVANADGTGVFDPPPPGGTNSYTERFDSQRGSQFQYTVGDKAITADGTSAETLTCSLSSARWVLAVISVDHN